MVLSQEYLTLGQKQVQEGNWEQAEQFYTQAIEINPNFHEGYMHLGDLFRFKKDLDGAIDCYIKSFYS